VDHPAGMFIRSFVVGPKPRIDRRRVELVLVTVEHEVILRVDRFRQTVQHHPPSSEHPLGPAITHPRIPTGGLEMELHGSLSAAWTGCRPAPVRAAAADWCAGTGRGLRASLPAARGHRGAAGPLERPGAGCRDHQGGAGPRDPQFAAKVAVILDLYQGYYQGKPLGPGVVAASSVSRRSRKRRSAPSPVSSLARR
jgi:hypothetical protein